MALWLFPALTAGVSAIFATMVAQRYFANPRRQMLLWTLGLYGIMGAALAQAYTDVNGTWVEAVYRAYYFLIGALVMSLGAGSLHLLKQKAVADYFFLATVGLVLAQAVACTTTPIDATKLAGAGTDLRVTGVGIASLPMRILTIVMSSAGALAMIAAALLSYLGARRPHNLFIVAGAVIFSTGGLSAGVAETGDIAAWGLYIGNLVGITLLFLGFLLSRPHPGSAAPAPSAQAAPSPPA